MHVMLSICSFEVNLGVSHCPSCMYMGALHANGQSQGSASSIRPWLLHHVADSGLLWQVRRAGGFKAWMFNHGFEVKLRRLNEGVPSTRVRSRSM